MKIVRVAMLVMALAVPVFADDIPNGIRAAGEIPYGDALLALLTLILR